MEREWYQICREILLSFVPTIEVEEVVRGGAEGTAELAEVVDALEGES